MKFRLDFVTNSSSSSFIIVYKKPHFDNKTLETYQILKNFNKFIEFILKSKDSKYVDTTEYKTEEEILKYFKNDYHVMEKEVSYYNHYLKEMIRDMDSEEFKILYEL